MAPTSHMILKINSLGDEDVIENLCLASQAGARVDLVVRGICCLRPGIPGVSDNIRVRSIVGRFLEHSRIWYFSNGGREEIYLGSADLMSRNLDERVEVMTRLEDGRLKRRVRDEILAACLTTANPGQTKGTYLRNKFHRLKARMGTKKAAVAVAHKILVAIFHMLQRGIAFVDLGGNYLDGLNKHRTAKRLVQRLDRLGYDVILRPKAAA